jgi:hypothetical protein
MAMAVVFALAPILSLGDANQPAVGTTLAEKTDHTTPHPFEPKDVVIETPRQGKSKGL